MTSRGNDGREIFRDDEDCAAFVALVARAAVRFRMNVHAWCRMTNHYHLIVESVTGQVSGAFHYLNGRYAQRFNDRHGRTGHLFGGRFHATLLEDERHFDAACAYVVLNPVRAGLVATTKEWRWAGAVGSSA